MHTPSMCGLGTRRRAALGAALLASLPFWAGAQTTPAEPKTNQAGQLPAGLYTVINLGPEPTAALLNERGQAAFTVAGWTGTAPPDGVVARDHDGTSATASPTTRIRYGIRAELSFAEMSDMIAV